MKTKRSYSAQLEELGQAIVKERQASREAELNAQRATMNVEERREERIDAVAAGSKIEEATRAHREAEDRAADAGIAREAAQRRLERAQRERERFQAEHAKELLRELEPAAAAAVERLSRGVAELRAGDAEWQAVSGRVGELLVGLVGASARTDAPTAHGLEGVVNDLRRHDGEVTSPLPHYRGRRMHEDEQRTVTLLRAKRERKTEDALDPVGGDAA